MDELLNTVSATIAETTAAARPVSLVAIELDRLDALRSTLGSPNADELCEQVAHILQRILRTGDYVTRISEGELLAVLVGAGSADARSVAQRISAAVRGHPFAWRGGVRNSEGAARVTVSAGVAAAPELGVDPGSLVDAARRARAAVVQRGGDGVAVAAAAGADVPPAIPDLGRFAGRVDERRALLRALEEASQGQPRIVSIVGEAGSGTLTLARQLEPEVRILGGSLVAGRSVDSAVRVPYGPWRGVFSAMRRLAAPPGEAWRELPKLVPDIAGGAPSTAGTKYRLLEEISGYLRGAARQWPLVVVLDEMQWADEDSWDALAYLVEQLTDERLLICLTMRSGAEFAAAIERRAAVAARPGYQEIALSRLTRDEVKRWLEAALDHQEVGRELLAFLYRHTEGNPFLLTQLVRCLVDEGALWHSGQRWEWKAVSELRIPPGMDGIVTRRIAHLPESTQAVLATAAVLGRDFDVPLLAAAGAGSPAVVQLAVDEALAAGILVPTFERRRKAFALTHESISNVLVRGMPSERVRHLHRQWAQALQERQEGSAAEVALHFDAAGAAESAYQAALDAATDAESVYAYNAAQAYLQMATRNATWPGELAESRVRMAQIADVLGRYDEEEELCDLAIEWYASQGDRDRTLMLRRMRERARKELGQPARHSFTALLALDDEAAAVGNDRERVAILTLLSQTHSRLGEAREAERLAAECVRMAENLDDPALLAEALNRLAVTVISETPDQAKAYYERALELFARVGDVRGQARCHNNIGIIAQRLSDIESARQSFDRAIALTRAAGIVDLWGTAALNLGVLYEWLGDYERALATFGDALNLVARVKNSELQLIALLNMAHVERERGEYASGAQLYDSTAALAQRIGQAEVEISARAGEGLCLLALQKADEARRPLAEAESRMAGRTEWFQGRELVDALRVLMAAAEGRATDALQAFETARGLADSADAYRAAWLTAVCAEPLFAIDQGIVRAAVERYASRVDALGFEALRSRYERLQHRV
ncbi:MAG TPA: AAA family ATPase [Gemmatimonadaceae bacterium]|nr:AAA family ATPase [Gemmatimonadaceae bacterium]